MATQLSVEEAMERARRATEDRMESVRDLATARVTLADVREQGTRELDEIRARHARELKEVTDTIAARTAEAERADVVAYDTAISAGWSTTELRKIGYGEPDKRARVARRRKASARTQRTPASPVDETPNHTIEQPAPAHDFPIADEAIREEAASVLA